MRDLDNDSVRRLLKAVIRDTYLATGINEDCSYLLCNVTSGKRELRFMKQLDEREGGLRTRDALHRRRRADAHIRRQFDLEVADPNAADAAAFAAEGRATLLRLGLSSVVFDPAVLNVGARADELGVEILFERDDYLEINGSILREFAKRVFVCPGCEFSRGLASDVDSAQKRGTPLLQLDGSELTQPALDVLVDAAHGWMRAEGFTEEEIAAY